MHSRTVPDILISYSKGVSCPTVHSLHVISQFKGGVAMVRCLNLRFHIGAVYFPDSISDVHSCEVYQRSGGYLDPNLNFFVLHN